KLIRVVLTEKTDWYAHHALVVARDGLGKPDFNGVVVVVLRVTLLPNFLSLGVFQVVRHRQEFQLFVATTVFDVGEPPGRYLRTLMTVVLHDIFDFDVVRDGEQQGVTPTRPALRVRAHPHLIVLNQGENLFIRHRVHVADYGKQDVAVNEPIHEVTQKGKWWVGDHDVCLVTQCRDFVATEVTVAVEV